MTTIFMAIVAALVLVAGACAGSKREADEPEAENEFGTWVYETGESIGGTYHAFFVETELDWLSASALVARCIGGARDVQIFYSTDYAYYIGGDWGDDQVSYRIAPAMQTPVTNTWIISPDKSLLVAPSVFLDALDSAESSSLYMVVDEKSVQFDVLGAVNVFARLTELCQKTPSGQAALEDPEGVDATQTPRDTDQEPEPDLRLFNDWTYDTWEGIDGINHAFFVETELDWIETAAFAVSCTEGHAGENVAYLPEYGYFTDRDGSDQVSYRIAPAMERAVTKTWVVGIDQSALFAPPAFVDALDHPEAATLYMVVDGKSVEFSVRGADYVFDRLRELCTG